ncbi:hypothetical protein ABIF66_011673 [Bradyrhizobium japonicum]
MKVMSQQAAETRMDVAKAIYVSVELSQSTWLVTSFVPAIDTKMARKGSQPARSDGCSACSTSSAPGRTVRPILGSP